MLVSQPAIPEQLALVIEARQIVAGIKTDDVGSVAGGRRRRDGHLGMTLRAARRPELAVPANFSVRRVAGDDVQAVLIVTAACGDDRQIADNNRPGNAAAGKGRRPDGLVESRRPRLGDSVTIVPAELPPVGAANSRSLRAHATPNWPIDRRIENFTADLPKLKSAAIARRCR